MTKNVLTFAVLVAATGAAAQEFVEGFDNVGGPTSNGQMAGANLEANGWFLQNNSAPGGLTDWFQGNLDVFPAFQGSGYIAANYNNSVGTTTISNWLVTPTVLLQNGNPLVFWTRTVSSPTFPDRLQVRMSTSGASTNVGSSATDVGVFTNLLVDINPAYTTAGYPTAWTQYTVFVSGLGSPTVGRFAFRYFVENGGPTGANSDYVAIDSARYLVPEPATILALTAGLAAVARRRRRP